MRYLYYHPTVYACVLLTFKTFRLVSFVIPLVIPDAIKYVQLNAYYVSQDIIINCRGLRMNQGGTASRN